MAYDHIIVDSLREFHTEEEIRGFWAEALDALLERRTGNVVINNQARDGQSDSGVVLKNEKEIRDFIETCKEAIRRIQAEEAGDDEIDEIDPGSMGRGTDRSQRTIRV